MKDWLLKQVVATFDPKTPEECILIGQIEEEISRVVEPDYWHVVDKHGASIYSASFKEACMDHINDVIERSDTYSLEEAASWVVRPLFAHPPAKPVLLDFVELHEAIRKARLNFTKRDGTTSERIAKEIEQAVLRKNGLGGTE